MKQAQAKHKSDHKIMHYAIAKHEAKTCRKPNDKERSIIKSKYSQLPAPAGTSKLFDFHLNLFKNTD